MKVYLIDSHSVVMDDILNSPYVSNFFNECKNEETRKEKIISNYLKNKYIGKYHIDENGKPLADHTYFNISHSHGLVAFIQSDVPIGIDIEKIRPISNTLQEYISNDSEKKYIHDEISFFEVWTNKEALIKCFGSGLKTKAKDIPALPINDRRIYKNNIFFNKTIRYKDYIITVSRQKDEDFDVAWDETRIECIYGECRVYLNNMSFVHGD